MVQLPVSVVPNLRKNELTGAAQRSISSRRRWPLVGYGYPVRMGSFMQYMHVMFQKAKAPFGIKVFLKYSENTLVCKSLEVLN
jgi:hypothetical protein